MDIAVTANLRDEIRQSLKERYPKIHWHYIRSLQELDTNMAQQVEAVVTFGGDITEEAAAQLPSLRWIQILSAGVENLPFDALQARHIQVTNARGIHAIPMAEFAIGLMLQEVKQFTTLYEQQQRKEWYKKLSFGECFGKTLTVIGTGAIGTAIANLAKALGMHVIGVNRTGGARSEFDEIVQQDRAHLALEKSDFVVIVAPLTASTKHWFNDRMLSCMKPDSVLINLGRGELIVEEDLIHILKEEKIARAYLDVFQVEPLPADSPLWSLPNCVITPHVSALTPLYVDRSVVILEDNLKKYLQQEALVNTIDLEARY